MYVLSADKKFPSFLNTSIIAVLTPFSRYNIPIHSVIVFSASSVNFNCCFSISDSVVSKAISSKFSSIIFLFFQIAVSTKLQGASLPCKTL